MTHLGSWVTALADGQLDAATTERALAHVANCDLCAAELSGVRASRRALAGAPEVTPTPELTARLLALSAEVPPAGARPGRDPVRSSAPLALTGAGPGRPGASWRRGVGAGAGVVGLVAVALFSMGDAPVVTPSTHLAEPITVLAGAATFDAATGRPVAAGAAPAVTLDGYRRHGFVGPAALPTGWSVVSARLADDGAALRIDLAAGSGTASMVVRERTGRLDVAAVAGADTWREANGTVYVLSRRPWHLVWQSRAAVVDLVADAEEVEVRALVAGLPPHRYDSGVPARIHRGWATMTGAFGRS